MSNEVTRKRSSVYRASWPGQFPGLAPLNGALSAFPTLREVIVTGVRGSLQCGLDFHATLWAGSP